MKESFGFLSHTLFLKLSSLFLSHSVSLVSHENQPKAWLLSKFYFGEFDIPASEFLESKSADEVTGDLIKISKITEAEKTKIRKYISNFQNWSRYAAQYIKANTLEVRF